MNSNRRNYTAATNDARCVETIKLRDGSTAQCMRRRATHSYCTQHARIILARIASKSNQVE